MTGIKNKGYMICNVRKHGLPGFKNYPLHRFVWECYNGIIPSGKEIDHVDNNPTNDKLSNLQLLTPKENNQTKDNSNCAINFGQCVNESNKI